ncbi:calcium-transporting atpase [Holotrichia oblita]|nr:calcium-transporting atpase [Holotrichia oblita]
MHSRDINDALDILKTTKQGLSSKEAEERLIAHGENKLAEVKKPSILYKFFMQFKNVMVMVLLAAAVITSAVAIIEKNYSEFVDVCVILAIIVINAIIGVIQESKAEHALEALKKMSQPFAKVRRGGEIIKIETSKIVTGDIVILEAGDVVPADMRLLQTASLKIEESSLTGESIPVEKDATVICTPDAPLGDMLNMAFSSCVVSYGRGEGVVMATGMNTQMGQIANMLRNEDETETPLQRRLNKTGKFISISVLVIALVIFAVSVIGSALSSSGINTSSVLHAFMTAVAIAVAAIPEGLTAVITIIMAIGIQKMSKRNAIIKKMTAVETLGSTEIICSDKTGTLTLNKMTVTKIFSLGEKAEQELNKCMVLCNDTIVKYSDDKKIITIGDPTETALTNYVDKCGIDVKTMLTSFSRVEEQPFDSERKMMTTINDINGTKTVFSKGAPDILLTKCTHILDGNAIREMTQADRDNIIKQNRAFAMDALRVLAFAQKVYNGGEFEKDLVFLGLAGMIDPPRSEVKEAVRICKKAGIIPVMITGDHRDTAYAIAKEIGIAQDETQVTTGAAVAQLSDEELIKQVHLFRVYARVSPEHKVRIVKAWQATGKTVAMTGDGVNDAPSLKTADIGVGMGITGTDVTKGAADMVLSDDNFATIVVAVQEGGVIMDVTTPEQAKIAQDAGAVAVMALERVPSDIRRDGGVARMSDPKMIVGIKAAVSIPVMAKVRIGHIVEARVLEALGVDYIDESEVLTPADDIYHINKKEFQVPFVCGARGLGEALRRIGEGACMIRTKGEAGTGNVVEAVRHMRTIMSEIRLIANKPEEELMTFAKEIGAPYDLVLFVAKNKKLPVVNFAAGGIATPSDAALMMELGSEGVFVGSGIFKSSDPERMAKAIVQATANYKNYDVIAKVSEGLGSAMRGLEIGEIPEAQRMDKRGW